jgi:hypothetical protein
MRIINFFVASCLMELFGYIYDGWIEVSACIIVVMACAIYVMFIYCVPQSSWVAK